MEQEKINKQIFKRLGRLESAVFGSKKSKDKLWENKIKDFKGIAGGIRLLLSKDFFKNKKKTFVEIKEALGKKGYHSSRQAVQVALDQLSISKGPLVKIKERGKNYYAERK